MNVNNEAKTGALLWNIKKVISKGNYMYALVPEHPHSTKNGYVLMHRIIMENYLGRVLNDNEIVHHINKNKLDNRIENLQLMNKTEHLVHHGLEHGRMWAKLKCPWCGKIFEKEKNQTFLQKHNKYNCTFCSTNCRGKFSRYVQLNGVTKQVEDAISGNLLSLYRKYKEDNSEETNL